MKALHIHNRYRYRGGEDVMFERIGEILRANGHEVVTFERRSNEVNGTRAKLGAMASSVYSPAAKREVSAVLRSERPDVVHVHNLYPLISPSALEACAEHGVPVVMRCPNYRLECPTGILMRNGRVCDDCSGGREYNCALNNCRGNVFESVAFATRNTLTRMHGLFHRHVRVFAPPSHFVKSRLVAAGFPEERIRVIPNVVPLPSSTGNAAIGEYIALAGRFSEEKGIETLLDAARLVPHVPVRIAGEGPLEAALRADAPANVTFVGQLSKADLGDFYANARACVVPSRWYEAFGLVAAEAMSYAIPVIATRMAGLAEIVDDGETGFHFPPNDAIALAQRMEQLWANAVLAKAMGESGRRKVEREYSVETYYKRLISIYELATGAVAERQTVTGLANIA